MSQALSQFEPLIVNWSRIFFMASIGLVLAIVLSLFRPLEYSAVTRIGITQDIGTVDAFTASRSAERIADNLSESIYHSVVFDAILDRFPQIDESYFGETTRRQRRTWAQSVSTSVTRGSGLLTVRAYHTNPDQAEVLSKSVATFLAEDGWRFTSGSGITIQIVDDVLVSRFPVRPNLLINGASGFVLGGLAGIIYVLAMLDRLKKKHHLMFE